MEVTYVLGGAMVHLGRKAASIAEGTELCRTAIWSGKAYEKFLEIVTRQGGDTSFIKEPARYPAARHVREVRASSAGYITGFSTMRIGVLAVELGAGRLTIDDVIDPKAGIVLSRKIGDRVDTNDVLAIIHTDKADVAERAVAEFGSCVTIGPTPGEHRACVRAFVDRSGVRDWTSTATY
jgi:thymidine phosphorylase